MAFTPKTWQDSPSTSTPLSAAALQDMESRLSRYTDVTPKPAPWAASTAYTAGTVIDYNGTFYRALQTFTSGSTFNPLNWTAVPLGGSPRLTNPYAGNVGVTTHLRKLAAADMVTGAAQIKNMGLDWIREDVSWNATEPNTKGTYVWTVTDNLMTACAQAGLKVLPVVSATPTWAGGGSTSPAWNTPPTNNQDYADFLLALWNRYGAGGAFWTANPGLDSSVAFTYLELWNEPFNISFFTTTGSPTAPYVTGGPDPEKYAAMCVAAGTTLRAATGSPKILICGEPFANTTGSMSGTSDTAAGRFFQRVLTAQPSLLTSNLFDGYAIHPYAGPFYYGPYDIPQGSGSTQMLDPQGRFDRVRKAQRQLAEAMLKNGVSGTKEMWVTEFGWKARSVQISYGVGDDFHAEYSRDGMRRLFREWAVDNDYGFSVLSKAFFYTIDTLQTSAANVDDGSLLKFNGASQPGAPTKASQNVQTVIRAGDGVEAYTDAVLKKEPVLFCPLSETTTAIVRDRATQLTTQAPVITPSGVTRGGASLTTEPEGASTIFDGSTSTITVPSTPQHTPSSSTVTLEVWAKFGHTPTAAEDLVRKFQTYTLQTNAGSITGTGNTSTSTNPNQITNITGTNWRPGIIITGAGIPANTKILDYSGTTLTISNNVTATATGVTITAQTAGILFGIYTTDVPATSQNLSLLVADSLDVNLASPYHIVGVYDNVNQYIYINGRLRASAAKSGGTTLNPTTNPVGIGWRGTSATGYFNGNLQNAAIYPRPLSPKEIGENYQAGRAVYRG